jgi:enamine deaminase RidA (YjgF/YER057c/UK114 family)
MMNRFTNQAQEALQRAQQLMFDRQHTQLDVEHIFMALLQQRNSLAARIMVRAGGDVESMRQRLDDALKSLEKRPAGSGTTGYIALRGSRAIQGSAEEADRLNDEFISTEHLLIAVAAEGNGATARILQEAGIDQEKVRAATLEIRGDPNVPQEDVRRESKRKQIVNPPNLAESIGFNHGILTTGGQLLFLAGQAALDKEGRVVAPGDVVAQYRETLNNLEQVVQAAGGKMADIVKMTIFVKDRDDYKAHLRELGRVHKGFFGAYYPATALLEVSRFFEEGVLVEIEGIAVIGVGD